MQSHIHRRNRLARRGWNLRTWRKIHWSDESWFLLHTTDGRIRVWSHTNTAFTPKNIRPTTPFGGGSAMVWGCLSHDCKMDVVTVNENLKWLNLPKDLIRRLTGGMRRRVEAVIRARGGYTRYCRMNHVMSCWGKFRHFVIQIST